MDLVAAALHLCSSRTPSTSFTAVRPVTMLPFWLQGCRVTQENIDGVIHSTQMHIVKWVAYGVAGYIEYRRPSFRRHCHGFPLPILDFVQQESVDSHDED